jgi:hypothetical protein
LCWAYQIFALPKESIYRRDLNRVELFRDLETRGHYIQVVFFSTTRDITGAVQVNASYSEGQRQDRSTKFGIGLLGKWLGYLTPTQDIDCQLIEAFSKATFGGQLIVRISMRRGLISSARARV